mgnify:CR=1 FL=1
MASDMKLRLPGQGTIPEQANRIREHHLVINGLKAVMSTTLCGSIEVLRLSTAEGSSAHFRYLVNDMSTSGSVMVGRASCCRAYTGLFVLVIHP